MKKVAAYSWPWQYSSEIDKLCLKIKILKRIFYNHYLHLEWRFYKLDFFWEITLIRSLAPIYDCDYDYGTNVEIAKIYAKKGELCKKFGHPSFSYSGAHKLD